MSTTWSLVLLWSMAALVLGWQVRGVVRDVRGRS